MTRYTPQIIFLLPTSKPFAAKQSHLGSEDVSLEGLVYIAPRTLLLSDIQGHGPILAQGTRSLVVEEVRVSLEQR